MQQNMKTKPLPPPLPDQFDDDEAIMERIVDAVSGADGYWPRRVQTAFESAGFRIRRVQREECHQSVWQIWLTCGSCQLSQDKEAAATEVRRVLRKHGLRIPAGDLTVLEQRGERVKCAFMFGPEGPPVFI